MEMDHKWVMDIAVLGDRRVDEKAWETPGCGKISVETVENICERDTDCGWSFESSGKFGGRTV